MKYQIGDIFEWTVHMNEVSTLTDIWYDWDGETKYTLQSYRSIDFLTEEELQSLIQEKIAIHYPVKK